MTRSVVIVGCGRMGTRHALALATGPVPVRIGLVSRGDSKEMLAYRLTAHGLEDCTLFDELDAALEAMQPTLVIVATPLPPRCALVRRALSAGAHVLAEKPLTLDPEAARGLAAAARAADRVLAVGHLGRFHPGGRTFLEGAEGLTGPKRLTFTVRAPTEGAGWKRQRSLLESAPAVLDTGAHYVDLALRIMGRAPRAVRTSGRRLPADAPSPSHGRIELDFGEAGEATIDVAWGPTVAPGLALLSEMTAEGGALSLRVDASGATWHGSGAMAELAAAADPVSDEGVVAAEHAWMWAAIEDRDEAGAELDRALAVTDVLAAAAPRPPVALADDPQDDLRLDDAQIRAFDEQGLLVLPGVLDADAVARLIEAGDRLIATDLQHNRQIYAGGRYDGFRHVVALDDAFLGMIAHPRILAAAVQLLGTNLHLITSHLLYRQPDPDDTSPDMRAPGWHRDISGTTKDLGHASMPRLGLKCAYVLSDASMPGSGMTRFAPGSHRWSEAPDLSGRVDPPGAFEPQLAPGDAVLFENRTYHAGGPVLCGHMRKLLFMGYGYRWLRPLDYGAVERALLDRLDPVGQQLLGGTWNDPETGRFLPGGSAAALAKWAEARGLTTPQERRG